MSEKRTITERENTAAEDNAPAAEAKDNAEAKRRKTDEDNAPAEAKDAAIDTKAAKDAAIDTKAGKAPAAIVDEYVNSGEKTKQGPCVDADAFYKYLKKERPVDFGPEGVHSYMTCLTADIAKARNGTYKIRNGEHPMPRLKEGQSNLLKVKVQAKAMANAKAAAAIDTKAAAPAEAKDNAKDNAEDDAVDVFAALAAGVNAIDDNVLSECLGQFLGGAQEELAKAVEAGLKAIDAAKLDDLVRQFMDGAIKKLGKDKFLTLLEEGYQALSKVSKVEFSAEERESLKFPNYTLMMPDVWKEKKKEWEDARLTVSCSGAQGLVFNALLQVWTFREDRIAGKPQAEAETVVYDGHELPVERAWLEAWVSNQEKHYKRATVREGGKGTPLEQLLKLLHEELHMKLKAGVEINPSFYLVREKRDKKTGEVTGYSATPVYLIPAEYLEEDKEAVAQASRCNVFSAKKLSFTKAQIGHLNILDDDGNVKPEHSKFWRRGGELYFLKNPYGEVKPLGPKFPSQVNSMLADYAKEALKNGGELSRWGENALLENWDTIFGLMVDIALARVRASMASIAA